eukprot:3864446-Amphidinium_carterae.1
MGDANRPHQTLHLPMNLQRRTTRQSHLMTKNQKIPTNFHSGKVLKFMTSPLQDHPYQSW